MFLMGLSQNIFPPQPSRSCSSEAATRRRWEFYKFLDFNKSPLGDLGVNEWEFGF